MNEDKEKNMSSKIYELINSIPQCTDLILAGQQLIEFADAVYNEKNKVTILNHFYVHLYQWAFLKYLYNDTKSSANKNYYICDEMYAVSMFIAWRMPTKSSPVRTLKGIKLLGENIIKDFTKPVGKCISKKMIEDILQYLDKKYSLSSKLFINKKAAFIRIHNTHIECNSECLSLRDKEKKIFHHFFLYHMKKNSKISPEAVLFHEFGHALHMQCYGNIEKVPDNIIDFLEELCFPKLKESDDDEKRELFADVLATGLMYQTPFEKYDPAKDKIHPDDKKAFKMLVETMIEMLI